MALCVARCPEWQTSPLAYLDGLLAIYSDKITQSWPGYRTVARIQLSFVTRTAVLKMSRWAGLQKDSQASAVAFLESLDQVQFDAFGSLGVFYAFVLLLI